MIGLDIITGKQLEQFTSTKELQNKCNSLAPQDDIYIYKHTYWMIPATQNSDISGTSAFWLIGNEQLSYDCWSTIFSCCAYLATTPPLL